MDTILQFATPVAVLVAAAGLFLGARNHRRQMNVQTFLTYTERYERIMQGFPADAVQARLDLEGEPPPDSEELRIATLGYLNLCAEEYYLYKRRYLAKDVWEIWEGEMRRTVASPLYRRAWKTLKAEFESFPDFITFVEEAQRTSTSAG